MRRFVSGIRQNRLQEYVAGSAVSKSQTAEQNSQGYSLNEEWYVKENRCKNEKASVVCIGNE